MAHTAERKPKSIHELNGHERQQQATGLASSFKQLEKAGLVKTEGSYRVLINNEWVTKKYTVYGTPGSGKESGYAEKVKSYFEYMSKSETGLKALKAFAQSNDNLYIVQYPKQAFVVQVVDPKDSRKNAHMIVFDETFHSRAPGNQVKLYPLANPNDRNAAITISPQRIFTHEFGHVLQNAGVFFKHYDRSNQHLPNLPTSDRKLKEAHATRFANDVAVEQGAQHYRKHYRVVNNSGIANKIINWMSNPWKDIKAVDTPTKIEARKEENIKPYSALTNKKEYMTYQQIQQLGLKNGVPYTLKDNAKGELYLAESTKGESTKVRLYHYSDVVSRHRKQSEVKQDFIEANSAAAVYQKTQGQWAQPARNQGAGL